VNHHSTRTNSINRLDKAQASIPNQRTTKPLALPGFVNSAAMRAESKMKSVRFLPHGQSDRELRV
jgi:hypothetical protein